MINETGEQIEFTPRERRWWTFKFIITSPLFSLIAFIRSLGDED